MTPHPKYPGVFVEEVPTGMRTIDGVSPSVTAFVGAASRGRNYRAVRINSFCKFEERFGGLVSNYDLGYAVQQFFLNGGKDAWVVRVARQLTAAKIIKGIHALDAVDIFNLLVIPGVVNSEALSAAADSCRQRRAFLILDAPKSAETPAQMAQAVRNATLPKTSYGAAYFPWIKIPDPLNSRKLRLTPPSGSIAGLFARTDNLRGVWTAPAGTDAAVIGVSGLSYNLTDSENGALNAESLWAQIRLNVGAFLQQLFCQRAFQGSTPRDAYFVKCDAATTTQNDIDAGLVNVVVGFAPLRRAEFVV